MQKRKSTILSKEVTMCPVVIKKILQPFFIFSFLFSIFCFLAISSTPAQAQSLEWERTWGGAGVSYNFEEVVIDDDGNTYAASYRHIVQTQPDGSDGWETDTGFSPIRDLYIAGNYLYVTGDIPGSITAKKYNLSGNYIETYTYDYPVFTTDRPVGIAADASTGNVYVCGYAYNPTASSVKHWLVLKFVPGNPAPDVPPVVNQGGGEARQPKDIDLDSTGVYVGGSYSSPYVPMLIKYRLTDLGELWDKDYGSISRVYRLHCH
ncbi:hypothetical protein ACFL2Y_04885, partial [Candidatus Omnitrophota bacterium]